VTLTPTGIDHVAINVPDVAAALEFYTEVLGLEQNLERPDFEIAGAWLDAGGQQVHLIELPVPPNLGQHFAVLYDDLDAVVGTLRAQGLAVSDPRSSGPSRRQTSIADPWGNRIELHERRRAQGG
jgi:glyoxylase I family protein